MATGEVKRVAVAVITLSMSEFQSEVAATEKYLDPIFVLHLGTKRR